MAILAVWFQETDAISSGNAKLLMVFIGLVAVSMVVQAIVLSVVALRASKTIKELKETTEELKGKLLPLIDSAMELGQSADELLRYTSPKVKVISDNLLETSKVVRASAQQLDKTITDVNLRTQRQVAGVDGMVTAALTTTQEIVETIQEGIRVPAKKIALVATQLKLTIEGIVARVKSKAGSPYGTGSR